MAAKTSGIQNLQLRWDRNVPYSPHRVGRNLLTACFLIAALNTPLPLPASPQQQPAVNAGNPSTCKDFEAGDQDREALQRSTDLLKHLNLSPGDWVADVGAGAGYYSMRLSAMVGPKGLVFAEEVSDSALRWLDSRVKVFDLHNLEIVNGQNDDPKLPPDSLAAVLVVNAYHHFRNYQPMCEQIFRSLKPGGRLVIADYSLPSHREKSRSEQIQLHEIDPALVRAELTQAGFQAITCDEQFVPRNPDAKFSYGPKNTDLWLMTATRPQ